MGYSNETPNYHLPQYVADDRPSYLGDWNEAMGKIDAGMEENKEATAANGVSITNMKEYVDNTVDDVNESLANTTAAVDESIAAVNIEVDAMGVRLDGVDAKIKYNPNKVVLVIGDSYSHDDNGRTGIVTQLRTISPNWTIINASDSGAGFTMGGVDGRNFTNQVTYGATLVNPATVDYVIIAGGRNDVGAQASEVTPTIALQQAAEACFANAKTTFPNAQVLVFPMLYDWKHANVNVMMGLSYIKEACVNMNVWNADGCYTWGTGDEATLFIGGTDIHPNPTGSLYYAHKMYKAIINDNPYTWRNRSGTASTLTCTYENGVFGITGYALTDQGPNNLIAQLPSWFVPVNRYVYFGGVLSLDDGSVNYCQITPTGVLRKSHGDTAGRLCFNHTFPVTL